MQDDVNRKVEAALQSVDQVVTHTTFLHNQRHGHRRKHSGHCSASNVDVFCLLCLANHGLSAASNTEWLSLFIYVRRGLVDLRAGDAALHHDCYLIGRRSRMTRQDVLCECGKWCGSLAAICELWQMSPPRKMITPKLGLPTAMPRVLRGSQSPNSLVQLTAADAAMSLRC